MFEKSTSDARPDSEVVPNHACVVGVPRCWGTTLDNRGEKLPGVAVGGPFCEGCANHIGRVFDRLPAVWDALALLVRVRDREESTAKVALTPDPGVPLNVTADAKLAQLMELYDVAVFVLDCAQPGAGFPFDAQNRAGLLRAPAVWVQRWDRSGEVHGEEPWSWTKPAPRTYVPRDRAGDELNGRGRRLVQMSGADVALELWGLHDAVRGYFGGRKRDQRKHYPMPCHGCGARTLYREYGQELIKCIRCPTKSEPGRGWTEEQYHRLAGLTNFHLKVIEEDEMAQLDEAKQRAADAEARATAAEEKLQRVAEFAGHKTIDDLMSVIDQVGEQV